MGRTVKVQGISDPDLEEIVRFIRDLKATEPDLSDADVAKAVEREYPEEARLIRKERGKNYVRFFERLEPAYVVRPDRRSRLHEARAMLLKDGHGEIAEKYSIVELGRIARRLKEEGADPDRGGEDRILAFALATTGVLPWSVVDPEEERKVLRRRQPDMEAEEAGWSPAAHR